MTASTTTHLDSPAEALHHALVTLDRLGGATAYLRANGLTESQLAALRLRVTASSSARSTR
jgi:hypothetical protein